MKKIDKVVEIVRKMDDEELKALIITSSICPAYYDLENSKCIGMECEDCWDEEVKE